MPGVLAEPKPKVVTVAFLDQGVQYEVRFQIRDFAERSAIETTIRDRIWYVLHRAELPFAHGVNKLSALASDGADVDIQRTERARALRRIDFLRDLPDASIATLAGASRTEPYAPGEYVIRQGDVSEELYLCLSGELVVLHQGEAGQQREVARLHTGGLFGEFAQLTGQARAATVQAASSCELVVVDKAAFTQVLRENPALAELISERLAERRAELDALERATPELKRATVAQHKGQFLQRLREFFLD
jgi:CRP-like cAMP-binding protein